MVPFNLQCPAWHFKASTVKGVIVGRASGSNPALPPRTAPLNHSSGSLWASSEEQQEQLLRTTGKECQKSHCSSLESPPEGLGLDTAQVFPIRHILQSPELPKITVPAQPGHSKADCKNFKLSIKDFLKTFSLKSRLFKKKKSSQ